MVFSKAEKILREKFKTRPFLRQLEIKRLKKREATPFTHEFNAVVRERENRLRRKKK